MKHYFNSIEGNSENHLDVIKAILEEPGGMTICDLMCCEASQTHKLNVGSKIYVDVVERPIKGFDKTSDVFVQMDAIEFLKSTERRYSAIICLDGIEHITKKDGIELLELAEKKSDRVIIFTPLGDYVVETTPTDNPDAHKSGWIPEEFEDLGYACIVFPDFHKAVNAGAFFAFKCKDLKNEFNRVINNLNTKQWTKLN